MVRAVIVDDLPISAVARALGYDSAEAFRQRLGEYLKRGFPAPDPMTGRFDPQAFERWRRLRTPHLFPELVYPMGGARDAAVLAAERRARRSAVDR
ncbi:conserved hypothetical protein [Hyphomicrobiales bacterium]|nr:conserved hypothetical protein [Hyphomicrobiales bacterium]CAH1700594.1 conserved hypothetical protein [Hyphomicrobiales bacterium]CAI0344442.1 conserved hypothetical protein [Hyphomicrobiales bacterium]